MYQKRKYNDTVDLNIISMDLLENSKGKLIHSICIDMNLDEVSSRVSAMLRGYLTGSTDNRANLYFRINDVNNKRNVTLLSKFKMPVTKQLVDYLREQELTFTVNDA